MPRRVYFFDASALCFRYLKSPDAAVSASSRRVRALFHERMSSPAKVDFQIPSICMAECSKAFAKVCFEQTSFGSREAARDVYFGLVDALLRDVREERLIHSYEIKREHYSNIEEIFLADYDLPPPRQGARLSSHDALIISCAAEFGRNRADGLDSVTLVTSDRRISDVCRSAPDRFPRPLLI